MVRMVTTVHSIVPVKMELFVMPVMGSVTVSQAGWVKTVLKVCCVYYLKRD
jgi:hypothetical protein